MCNMYRSQINTFYKGCVCLGVGGRVMPSPLTGMISKLRKSYQTLGFIFTKHVCECMKHNGVSLYTSQQEKVCLSWAHGSKGLIIS